MISHNSIVLELQKEIADDSKDVGSICKKALLIASKLKQDQIIDWLNFELNGYDEIANIPSYRKVRVEPKFINPYRGICPILMADGKLKNFLDNYPLGQSILSISKLIEEKPESLQVNLAPKIVDILRREMKKEMGFDFEIIGIGNLISLISIADSVKMKIMKWLIELEKNQVLGEDMSFTKTEIAHATIPTQTFYNSNIALVVTSTGNSVQNNNVSQTVDTKKLNQLIEQIESVYQVLPTKERNEIESRIQSAKVEIENGNIPIAQKSLKSVKTIAEGIAGNVAAEGIIQLISRLL